MKAIGIHIPGWLYRSDASIRRFARELQKTIDESGRYKAVTLSLTRLTLSSKEEARRFCSDNDLSLIVEHDSSLCSTDPKYKLNIGFLRNVVPFANQQESHELGFDKRATKRVLREQGIPVLDDVIATSLPELMAAMAEERWYVGKPIDQGAGAGVKLLRKSEGKLHEYRGGSWFETKAFERSIRGRNRIVLGNHSQTLNFALAVVAVASFIGAFLISGFLVPGLLLSMLVTFLLVREYEKGYAYESIMLEPYFNDDSSGFSSYRATVIGNQIVETVKRTNEKNITSNVSKGGTAVSAELSEEQQQIVLAAKDAIGADYAGVDLLVCGGKTVVGEVNVGPITVYSKYTGVPVGVLLGKHLMDRCDQLAVH